MTRRLLPIFLLFAACSSAADQTTTTAVTTTSGPAATTTTTTTSTTAATTTTTLPPPPPLGEIDILVTLRAGGFEHPIFVTARPGDERLYVVDQVGKVWALLDETRSLVLDITALTLFGGEQGLLGLAFHPTRPERLFVHYSGGGDGRTVIAEYAFPLGAGEANPAAVQTILEISQPAANHNGGMMAFGPDGYLYVALGDGGGGGDPFANGQDPHTLLGAILRFDVDAAHPYAIPATNPFADGADGAPEVWAFGLRNPWRFSFDGDDLWIGDVGQNEWEEIDRIGIDDGGANLGWNVLEGTHCFAGTPEQCADPTFTPPVFEYPHEGRCSITGGYVYRGSEIPGLFGTYLYSDYCSGGVMALRVDAAGTVTESVTLVETGPGLTSFGVDLDGEVYFSQGSAVYRIVPAP